MAMIKTKIVPKNPIREEIVSGTVSGNGNKVSYDEDRNLVRMTAAGTWVPVKTVKFDDFFSEIDDNLSKVVNR